MQDPLQSQAARGIRGQRDDTGEGKRPITGTVGSSAQGRTEAGREPFLVWPREVGDTIDWEIGVRVDIGEPLLNLAQPVRSEIDARHLASIDREASVDKEVTETQVLDDIRRDERQRVEFKRSYIKSGDPVSYTHLTLPTN